MSPGSSRSDGRRPTSTGVEGSAEMVAAGRKAAPEIDWLQQDLAHGSPRRPYDLIYSNAALHWLPDHAGCFPR